MIILLRLVLTLGLAALACEELVPASRVVLPLGGSELAQLGVFLVVIAISVEVRGWLGSYRSRRRRARRAATRSDGGRAEPPE